MPQSKKRKKAQSQSAQSVGTSADKDPSPTWYVVLMAGLMVAGVILVLARFVLDLNQYFMIGGLGAITVGFLMTTNYR